MLRMFFASLAAVLLLSGCGVASAGGALPGAPSDVADQTVLDEKAAIGVEKLYQTASLTVRTLAEAGVIRGAAAERAKQLDATAYRAVLAVRVAYDAGNATSYAEALDRAFPALSALIAAAGT